MFNINFNLLLAAKTALTAHTGSLNHRFAACYD